MDTIAFFKYDFFSKAFIAHLDELYDELFLHELKSQLATITPEETVDF